MQTSWKKRLTLAGAMALALGIGAGAGAHAAEETPKAATTAVAASTTPAPTKVKAVRDPSHRVPRWYGGLGVTAAQREAISKIRAQELERTNALKEQIAEIQDKALSDCDAILTPTQRALLTERREAAYAVAKARAGK